MRAWWRRLVVLGFRLLYNELAWLYDPVSWIVSLGQWRQWQRSVGPYLPPGGKVLEVGCGPGHLLADLATGAVRPAGEYQVVGIDLSRTMLRMARRNAQRRGVSVSLCRGRAQALPFAPNSFEAVVLTFPTVFVYHPLWIEQATRVLKGGGRLIVVEMAHFTERKLHTRFLEWLYRITGQRGPLPDLPGLLNGASLRAWRVQVEVTSSLVSLVLAEKGATDT